VDVRLRSDDDTLIRVELAPVAPGRHRCRLDGAPEGEVEVLHAARDEVVFAADGRVVRAVVARHEAALLVAVGGVVHKFTAVPGGGETLARPRPAASGRVVAPMPGKVLAVLVQPGQAVEAGQPVVIVEAMKMEHTLTAEVAGTVGTVRVAAGDMVEGAQLLLEIAAPGAAAPEPGVGS
jgi:biotin carboxyl carrier protein